MYDLPLINTVLEIIQKKQIVLVLGTSTARSKFCSARSKIYPLEGRSCSKCSKKFRLNFARLDRCSKKSMLELARLDFLMLEMLELRSVWNIKSQ